MEWMIQNTDTKGEIMYRRKYSNDTMRKLHVYIDYNKLKKVDEGYNETLDRMPEPFLKEARLREIEEISVDKLRLVKSILENK